ncbi:MAG: hypothetical protein ACKO7W_05930 [Elainella sp.]
MKPNPIVSALVAVVSCSGLLAPVAVADEASEADTIQSPSGRVIPYACYDRAGNVVFTTTNPQETVGWELGCREIQYESVEPASPPITYFQCFDENGGIAFSTVDEDVAEESDLFCREIGTRLSRPVVLRPVYYECFTTTGELAFTTSYPQDTYGWKPGCREQQSRDMVTATQPTDQPQTRFECLNTSGNVAFTTTDPQEVRRWKLGCRQVSP